MGRRQADYIESGAAKRPAARRRKPAPTGEELERRRDAIRRMIVDRHAKNKQTPVIYAVWHHMDDPKDIHLLEIAKNVSNPGDADWMTIHFLSPPEFGMPPGSKLHITYMCPEEFFEGLENRKSKGYKKYKAILANRHEILHARKRDARAARIGEAFEHGATTRDS